MWRPFARAISESVKGGGVTYLPAVRIGVVAITENGSEYSAHITLTTKAAVLIKRGGEDAEISLEDIVNDIATTPSHCSTASTSYTERAAYSLAK